MDNGTANVFHDAPEYPSLNDTARTLQRRMRETYATGSDGLLAVDPIALKPFPSRRAIVLDGQAYNKASLGAYFDTLSMDNTVRVPTTRRAVTPQEYRKVMAYSPLMKEQREVRIDTIERFRDAKRVYAAADVLSREIHEYSKKHGTLWGSVIRQEVAHDFSVASQKFSAGRNRHRRELYERYVNHG